MPTIEQGHVCEDRGDFVELLRWWLETSDEAAVGDVGAFGGKAWVYVEAGSARCHLNADTARPGVQRFLELVKEYGGDLQWRVVANEKGTVNRVAFGPAAETVAKFYLYTDQKLAAPRTL